MLLWQIIETVLIIILGVILHFLCDWSGKNKFVATFSAVNESTWEHLKLAFFPILLFGIVDFIFLRPYANNVVFATTIALFSSITIITILFYAYLGIIGKNVDVLNISIFVISVIVAKYISYRIMLLPNFENIYYILLCSYFIYLTTFCFAVFTFAPPKINLFRDPITGKYGV